MRTRFLLILALASAGCGDDGGGSGETADGTESAPTTESMSGTMSSTTTPSTTTSDTTGDPDDTTGATADETSDTTGAATSGTTEGSGSGSSDSGSSSTTGMTVDDCAVCEDDEVCVSYHSQVTTFECHPLPAGCEGDVDCECGIELCVDRFVACEDQPTPMQLACMCIAC